MVLANHHNLEKIEQYSVGAAGAASTAGTGGQSNRARRCCCCCRSSRISGSEMCGHAGHGDGWWTRTKRIDGGRRRRRSRRSRQLIRARGALAEVCTAGASRDWAGDWAAGFVGEDHGSKRQRQRLKQPQ